MIYKLLGSRSIAMQVAALVVNGASLAAMGWVACRRGRLVAVIIVLVPVSILTRAFGAEVLRSPWNPDLPLLPLLLLLLLAWSIAVGDSWMLPLAMVAATFAVQSHVGPMLEAVRESGKGPAEDIRIYLVDPGGMISSPDRPPHG